MTFAQEETENKVLISFALLAVFIACMGLFGMAAFTVDRRVKEIGVRKVMGAKVKDIVRLLGWQFLKPVLIANIIAVKDWQLGHEKTGEYYGMYSAELALMSAKIVFENSKKFSRKGLDARVIVEALISAGVASCIAGSSRPCSGSEHLFSHALDKITPGKGLHGEKCGIGSIMMAKLQGQDWRKIAKVLKDIGAPVTAKQIGLKEDEVVNALVIAQNLRPDRYTILKEVEMTERKAWNLAKSTKII